MKLYTVPLAPNPTKVTLYIAEREAKGVDWDIEQIRVNTLKGKHKEAEHLARNPFGTLPVLELDDGTYLTESLTIIEYLEDQFPVGAIYPSNPKERAVAKNIERTASLKFADPAGYFVHYKKSPVGYPPNPEKAAELETEMNVGLEFINSLLSDGRLYLTGNEASVADYSVQASLQFLRFIEADVISPYPLILQWDQRFRAREAVQPILKW